MTKPTSPTPPITELVLAAATGIFLVGSESATRYYIDADHSMLMRVPGAGSSRGPGDGTWRRLHDVECLPDGGSDGGHGVVRVGARHRYQLGAAWWIQRRCTSLLQVSATDVPQESGASRSDAQFTYAVATAAEAREITAGLVAVGGDPTTAVAQLLDGTLRPLMELVDSESGKPAINPQS